MKKTLLIAGLTAGLTFGLSSFAQADTNSPGVLLTAPYVAACQNKANAGDQNFCHGFGQGVYDMYLMSRHPKKAPAYVCPPTPGPKRAEVLDDFVAWASQNTQYADKSAADTLMRYLANRFPCETPKKKRS